MHKYIGIPVAVLLAATVVCATQWGTQGGNSISPSTLATKATFGTYSSLVNAKLNLFKGYTTSNNAAVSAKASAATFGGYSSRSNAKFTLFKNYTTSNNASMALKAALLSPDIITPRLTNPTHRMQAVAGETHPEGTLCYFGTDSLMHKADKVGAASSQGLLGLAMGNYSGTTTGHYRTFGIMSTAVSFKVYSTGLPYYVGTLGATQSTQPSASTEVIRFIGWALSQTKLFFAPESRHQVLP